MAQTQGQRPGQRLWAALNQEKPLQMVGVINAYIALMATRLGYRALYLSGAGVANASYGLPDVEVTSLDNVLEDVQRITAAVETPLLVDIDTGWGSCLILMRAIKLLQRAGAAGIHLEDQKFPKKCGHLAGKSIVSIKEMVERIQAALDSREETSFVIMARTDAFNSEGLQGVIERALAYQEAGADMIFVEALSSLEDYASIKSALSCPVLANMTEFGKTPLFNLAQWAEIKMDVVLYPLSVMRVLNAAAFHALQEIRTHGTQENLLPYMQTRAELYDFLDYHETNGVL